MMGFLSQKFLDNTLQAWLIALISAMIITTIAWIVKYIFLRRLANITHRTRTSWDDVISKVLAQTKIVLIVVLALYLSSIPLKIPETINLWLGRIAFFTILIQVAIWGNELIVAAIQQYQDDHLTDEAGNVTTLRAASFLIKLALFSVIILLALDNAGIQITSLIASLGVGSIAVALAVQNILADLFASLSIAFDQPFVIGDFIIIGDYLGTVENIGLKTTRVRSLSGEQLIFANNDLLNSRIRNYKRMGERRILFSLGVTYQTPRSLVEKIPEMIREIIEAQEGTRFDRAHFKSFGDSALLFETVYYTTSPDYNLYMNIQQAINLELMRQFDENGIEFAYPTQTLFVQKEGVPTG